MISVVVCGVMDPELAAILISNALFSSTQQKVLGLLYGKPDQSFYANEISRWAQVGKGSLMRELERLYNSRNGLRPEPPDQRECEGLLGSAMDRLKDAHNPALSFASRFDLTYNAAHALALTAIPLKSAQQQPITRRQAQYFNGQDVEAGSLPNDRCR